MEKDDLSRIAPKLSSIEKKDVFLTPEGVFEDLPYSVQMAVSSKENLSLTDRIFRVISVGMTSAIILCILFVCYFSIFGSQPNASYADKSSEDSTHQQDFYFISGYLVNE